MDTTGWSLPLVRWVFVTATEVAGEEAPTERVVLGWSPSEAVCVCVCVCVCVDVHNYEYTD